MKSASPAFKYCVREGGKVAVMNLPHGKKCKACVIHGKRYMGPVYKKGADLKPRPEALRARSKKQ